MVRVIYLKDKFWAWSRRGKER